MAQILEHNEQRRALKNINSAIKDLENAKAFLQTPNVSGKYTISFEAEDGQRHTTTGYTEDKETLDLLVMNFKDREKIRIIDLAQENRIALDPEDLEILEFSI